MDGAVLGALNPGGTGVVVRSGRGGGLAVGLKQSSLAAARSQIEPCRERRATLNLPTRSRAQQLKTQRGSGSVLRCFRISSYLHSGRVKQWGGARANHGANACET